MSQRDTMETKRSEKVAAWLKRSSLCMGVLALLGLGLSGCVTRGTHDQALAELGKARQAAAQRAESDEREKAELEKQLRDATDVSAKVRLDRDELKTKADDLERKLETANQVLAKRAEMLDGALGRIGALTEKEQELGQTLSAAQGTIRELTIKNEAERAQTAALREDKQRLLGGTTTAQSEIARLQKRAGELETEAVRAKDLEKQVAEQNQEIGRLRQSVADRNALASAFASQGEEAKSAKQRVEQLTAELAAMSEESASLKRERDALVGQVAKLDEEKAEKEAEIKRLTGTYQDLEASLRSEIAKGDIKIKQVRDRLTINVVDRILFDSGSAKIKPEGIKVMKTVGEVLKKVTDKQIRIDGHTDNVPISARLKERFPSNWELSTSRATSVVRYLVDEAGIGPEVLTAAGHADTQPVAANDTEDGRMHNRRIEIALYPKDLAGLVKAVSDK
ncbi:MAG: OmpA family protein [Nitrospira sp.]|nr:OmpA family protein [Nitrospira sp.]MDH4328193.1 OmpA family protein [Nitrospira sp.]MDH5625327.1 OmpA family protein [Nitrospira sp.]